MPASMLFVLSYQRGSFHFTDRFATQVAAVARAGALMTDATCAAFQIAEEGGCIVEHDSEMRDTCRIPES